jgi:hypothetical protein
MVIQAYSIQYCCPHFTYDHVQHSVLLCTLRSWAYTASVQLSTLHLWPYTAFSTAVHTSFMTMYSIQYYCPHFTYDHVQHSVLLSTLRSWAYTAFSTAVHTSLMGIYSISTAVHTSLMAIYSISTAVTKMFWVTDFRENRRDWNRTFLNSVHEFTSVLCTFIVQGDIRHKSAHTACGHLPLLWKSVHWSTNFSDGHMAMKWHRRVNCETAWHCLRNALLNSVHYVTECAIINLVNNRDGVCLVRGANWIFKHHSS